ncbi:hypothetical protein ISS03_04280 [Patescibacteria group bacterium]|nr:hypothetical protein [Patescibacteria group bacterium]
MKQGTRANFTGNALEQIIYSTLERKDYQFVDKKNFEATRYLEQPVFTIQYPIARSVYDTQLYCDFILYHPTKHPNCLIIESKWQQSTGSVDEKFPFLVLNIKKQYPDSTIVVLDGGGYKKGAEKWLRGQVDEKLIHIFNMMEFQKWSNGEEL